MAVFRVEKNKGYTVMSNHHLRNNKLTLKAKGLLSQMLSLPEDWDYTLSGLSRINKESIDAIRTAIWELEKEGYVKRTQERNDKGKMMPIVYIIYEQPQSPVLENPTPAIPEVEAETVEISTSEPVLENPTPDSLPWVKPLLDNPTSDYPTSENPTERNKDILSKDKLNKDIYIINTLPPIQEEIIKTKETGGRKDVKTKSYKSCLEELRKNTGYYETLKSKNNIMASAYDEILKILADVMILNSDSTIKINQTHLPAHIVQERFKELNSLHMDYLVEALTKNNSKIKNVRAFILTAAYNAISTMDAYYTAQTMYDLKNMYDK